MNIKSLSLFLGFLFLLVSPSYADIRNIQDNYQLIYHILDENGDPVSGQTVALKIKKTSNGYWYDFNDATFKNSGWTAKSTNLSEDAVEDYYYYTFDPPATETSADQYVLLVDNADATYGDRQSAIACYQNVDFDYSANNVTIGDFVSGVIDDDALGSITELPVASDYTSARAGYLDNLDIAISSRSTLTAADVWLVGTRALTDKAGFSLSAAGIDSIWDELQSGHTTVGTFGKYLDSEISEIISNVAIDKIWDETLADHLTAGSTGKKLSEMPSQYNIYP